MHLNFGQYYKNSSFNVNICSLFGILKSINLQINVLHTLNFKCYLVIGLKLNFYRVNKGPGLTTVQTAAL